MNMELQEMFRYGYMFPPQDYAMSNSYLELPNYSYIKEEKILPPVATITSSPHCGFYDNSSDGWHTPSPATSLRSVLKNSS